MNETTSTTTATVTPEDPGTPRHPFLDKEGEKIRGLFDEIAPRYDLLNRIFSFTIDLWWRRKAVKCLRARSG